MCRRQGNAVELNNIRELQTGKQQVLSREGRRRSVKRRIWHSRKIPILEDMNVTCNREEKRRRKEMRVKRWGKRKVYETFEYYIETGNVDAGT